MKVRFRARAIVDLEEIHLYLKPRSPSGARNVLRAIHAAIGEIAVFPNSTPKTSDPDIRVKILGRYRYKIFYRMIDNDTVEFFMCGTRHDARGCKPKRWPHTHPPSPIPTPADRA